MLDFGIEQSNIITNKLRLKDSIIIWGVLEETMNTTEKDRIMVVNSIAKWTVLATSGLAMFWFGVYFETGKVEITQAVREWPRWFDLMLGIIVPSIIIPTLMSQRVSRAGTTRSILNGASWGALAGLLVLVLIPALRQSADPSRIAAVQSSVAATPGNDPSPITQPTVETTAQETGTIAHPILTITAAWFFILLVMGLIRTINQKGEPRQGSPGLAIPSQAIGAWFGLMCITAPFFGLPFGLEAAALAIAGSVLYCHWDFFLSEFRHRPVPDSPSVNPEEDSRSGPNNS